MKVDGRAQLTIIGNLLDACTEIAGVEQEFTLATNDTVSITLNGQPLGEAMLAAGT